MFVTAILQSNGFVISHIMQTFWIFFSTNRLVLQEKYFIVLSKIYLHNHYNYYHQEGTFSLVIKQTILTFQLLINSWITIVSNINLIY